MSDKDYLRLVDQWRRNRLTWTAEDIAKLDDKVRRIKREKHEHAEG